MQTTSGTTPRHRLHDNAIDGVITARALVALGVPESTVYHRCRDGGPWQRLAPGVVLMSTGHPTTGQLVTAALLHGGPDAVLTGLEACRRHGVRRGPPSEPPLHVLVPHDRQVRSAARIQVERSRRMPASVERLGVPLAPVPRAVIDAARRLRSSRDIAELLADPVQRGLCTVAHLAVELKECGRRRSATPRRVLAEVSVGVRSAAELDAKRLWHRSGLPEPWWNIDVCDASGRRLGCADAWFDEVALGWEINSFAWRLDPEAYAWEQERRHGSWQPGCRCCRPNLDGCSPTGQGCSPSRAPPTFTPPPARGRRCGPSAGHSPRRKGHGRVDVAAGWPCSNPLQYGHLAATTGPPAEPHSPRAPGVRPLPPSRAPARRTAHAPGCRR
jgi:hypothetical protein